jgi:hypothetical protein
MFHFFFPIRLGSKVPSKQGIFWFCLCTNSLADFSKVNLYWEFLWMLDVMGDMKLFKEFKFPRVYIDIMWLVRRKTGKLFSLYKQDSVFAKLCHEYCVRLV